MAESELLIRVSTSGTASIKEIKDNVRELAKERDNLSVADKEHIDAYNTAIRQQKELVQGATEGAVTANGRVMKSYFSLGEQLRRYYMEQRVANRTMNEVTRTAGEFGSMLGMGGLGGTIGKSIDQFQQMEFAVSAMGIAAKRGEGGIATFGETMMRAAVPIGITVALIGLVKMAFDANAEAVKKAKEEVEKYGQSLKNLTIPQIENEIAIQKERVKWLEKQILLREKENRQIARAGAAGGFAGAPKTAGGIDVKQLKALLEEANKALTTSQDKLAATMKTSFDQLRYETKKLVAEQIKDETVRNATLLDLEWEFERSKINEVTIPIETERIKMIEEIDEKYRQKKLLLDKEKLEEEKRLRKDALDIQKLQLQWQLQGEERISEILKRRWLGQLKASELQIKNLSVGSDYLMKGYVERELVTPEGNIAVQRQGPGLVKGRMGGILGRAEGVKESVEFMNKELSTAQIAAQALGDSMQSGFQEATSYLAEGFQQAFGLGNSLLDRMISTFATSALMALPGMIANMLTAGATGNIFTALGAMIFDKGGVIREPVAGVGIKSGRAYQIAWNGQPESVTPINHVGQAGRYGGRQEPAVFIVRNEIGPDKFATFVEIGNKQNARKRV